MLRQHRVTPKYWNVKYLLLPFLFYRNSSGVVRAFLQSCLAMHNGWRGYETLIVYIHYNSQQTPESDKTPE